MAYKSLQLRQLNRRMLDYASLKTAEMPPTGWVKAIRTALGMSMLQLSKRLGITKQSISAMEKREQEGTITINSLKEIANAMDMQLVYGFVPNDGSLHALIERRAKALAAQIVLRTSNTMKLEDQAISDESIKAAIEERAAMLQAEMPKILWD